MDQMKEDSNTLKAKIQELENELKIKDKTINHFQTQLTILNSRIEELIHQISQEVTLATQIQKLLSPTEIPNISGFEFSTKFIPGSKSGGDYFDIFEHEDKMKFGIVLASSSGYTMSALFLSILMKISAQVEARKGLEPEKMVSLIAKEMITNMQPKDQTSLFYGVIDRRTFEMKYCNVGKIDGLLQSPGKAALQELHTSNESGITKDFNFEPRSYTINLNSKDRIVLSSEGLCLTTDKNKKTWGKESLIDAIRSAPKTGVHDLRNEILFRNEKFSGLSEPYRDQTVIVMEVKDRVIKLAKK